MLTIDGSFGEGGGQILRSSLALSMITQTAGLRSLAHSGATTGRQRRLFEIALQYLAIDGRQRREVIERRVFVNLVHRGADESEFEHRAMVLDEARVGGATGGRQRRRASGHLGNRAGHEVDERPARRHEGLGVGGLPLDVPAGAVAGNRFAVIVDEAHSSTSGEAMKDLKKVLTTESVPLTADEAADPLTVAERAEAKAEAETTEDGATS